MKKIKKFGNVAPMLIILLLVVILSYFIEGRNGISYIALGDLVLNYSHSFYYFFDAVLLVLAVGGLYGALNKIPAYKKLLNGIVKKIGDKKKLFVIIFTIFFVLLTAFGGFNLLAWLFIPFVVSIVLLLGYDKFVALSSTVAATFIGAIGGFVLSFRDSTNQYASTYTTFDKAVGLSNIWSNFIPKLLLLIGGTVLLVLFIIKHIKDKEKVEEVSNNDVFYVEARTKTGVIIKEDYSDVKVWPLIVFGCLLLVILVLGFIPWNDLFGFTCFDRFHTWLTGLKIGKYAVFTGLISANLTAFGRWYDVGGYLMVITCITIFLLIMKCFYHVKFKELARGFVYGVKKLIPAVMVMVLAYSILVATYNNGFMETIINNAGDSFGDNAIVASLITIMGTILNVDLFYIVAGIVNPVVTALSDKADLNVYATLFQSFYGLIQIVGPTSLLLILGLNYLEVPYSKWLKYIWRLILELFILIFVVLIVVSLI